MKRVRLALLLHSWSCVVLLLTVLLVPSATAQQRAKRCGPLAIGRACPTAPEEDVWERLSRELNELASDPLRQGGRVSSGGVALLHVEVQRNKRAESGPVLQGAQPSEMVASASRESQDWDRRGGRPRYEQALAVLMDFGMSWGEACPLAAADAYGTDWLSESRRCIEVRTDARSYQAFVQLLTAHGASTHDACLAGERYWNGLSLQQAEEACGRTDR
jgi:hypothetical protein